MAHGTEPPRYFDTTRRRSADVNLEWPVCQWACAAIIGGARLGGRCRGSPARLVASGATVQRREPGRTPATPSRGDQTATATAVGATGREVQRRLHAATTAAWRSRRQRFRNRRRRPPSLRFPSSRSSPRPPRFAHLPLQTQAKKPKPSSLPAPAPHGLVRP